MQHFSGLPLEIKLLIVHQADVTTCVSLLRCSKQVRALTLASLEQRVQTAGFKSKEHLLSKYLLSFYSPCNKVSANDKFYYEINTRKSCDSFVNGLEDVSVGLDNMILTKNLFNESETSFSKLSTVDETSVVQRKLQDLHTNIPLLVNEDSTFFKITLALVCKEEDRSKRTKLLEINEKVRKSVLLAQDNCLTLQNNGCWQISYSLEKYGVEPPQFDYDYEVFENYTLAIKFIKFNPCYLLSKIEAAHCLNSSIIFSH